MSVLTDRLAILIDANGAGAIREFEKVGKAAERDLGKAQTGATQVGSSMMRTGAVMIGVGGVLVAGAKMAADASDEHRAAVGRLNNTIANAPQLIHASSSALQGQAAALSQVTVASRTQIITAQSLLGQFGLTQEQITRTIPLVIDLSRKMGIDLDSAARLVGKSIEGIPKGLQAQLGPMDKAAYAADHYGTTLKKLNETVGGFAENPKTLSGQLAILGNQFQTFKEDVGDGAAAAFAGMLGPLRAVGSEINQMGPGTKSAVGGLMAIGGVGLVVAGGLSVAVGAVVKMVANLSLVKDKASSAASGLRSVDGAAKGLSFAGAAVGLMLLTKRMDENTTAAKRWVDAQNPGGTIDEQIAATKKQIEAQRQVAESFAGIDIGGNRGDSKLSILGSDQGREETAKLRALQDQLKGLEGQQKDGKDASDLQARGLDEFGNKLGETSGSAAGAETNLSKLNTAVMGGIDAQHAYEQAQQRVADAQESAAQATGRIAEAQRSYQEAQRRVAEAEQARVDSLRKVEDAARAVATAEDKLAKIRSGGDNGDQYRNDITQASINQRRAQDSLADAEKKLKEAKTPADQHAAELDLEQKHLDLTRANEAVTASLGARQRDTTQATSDLSAAQDSLTGAQRDAAKSAQAVAAAQYEVGKAQQGVGQAQREAAKATREISNAQYDAAKAAVELRLKVDAQTVAIGASSQAMAEYAAMLDEVAAKSPAAAGIKITAAGVIDRAAMAGVGAFGNIRSVFGFASGTSAMPDGPFVVGEQGPEYGEKSGSHVQIFPNSSAPTKRALGAGGGGGSGQPLVVQLVLPDGRLLAETVTPHMVKLERGRR